MSLTLSAAAARPELLTTRLPSPAGETVTLRPLAHDDLLPLAAFLVGLSAETRWFSYFPSYDLEGAQALCSAIGRYDKLRLVIDAGTRIIGLIEFSMDIPGHDVERYAGYGIALDAATTCRFGPTIADDSQNRGLGGALFPHVTAISRRFGKSRILLWGGVLAENRRAIHYYTKCGFRLAGGFVADDGAPCLDMYYDLPAQPE